MTLTNAQMLYRFGPNGSDGDATMKNLLGGKGANLAEMAKLGLPIPPGVTIPTTYCDKYLHEGLGAKATWAALLAKNVIEQFGEAVVPEFGYMPLVSVRSGARVSMPGMMDTILNVGLTGDNIDAWCVRIGNRAAFDSHRRLIQMYATVVDELPHEMFEEILTKVRQEAKVASDSDLSAEQMRKVRDRFLALYQNCLECAFPDTLQAQLEGCIGAVFNSWESERAIEYRAAHNIPAEWGTAVNVQAMVFGNFNDQSATGVLFTRDPNTGAPGLFGEFLINAQGEDVVAGIRTPLPLAKMESWNQDAYERLCEIAEEMEAHAADMQDMEFTVQDGTLYVLQTRNGKRSARAAFKIAYDLAQEGVITIADAVKRVTGKQFVALRRPAIDPTFNTAPTVTGIPAAGSVVSGVAVFSAEEAKAAKLPCILVREETTPDDFGGMMAAVGILTRTGGATSHAAVVARGMDKTCVVGASKLSIDSIKKGQKITLDGATGRVWVGVDVPVVAGEVTAEAAALFALAGGTENSSAITLEGDSSTFVTMLPQKGWVAINAHALLAGDLHSACRRVKNLLTELESRKGLSGVLDFAAPVLPAVCVNDSGLEDILGLPPSTPKAAPADTVPAHVIEKGLCISKWTKTLTKRWVINLPKGDQSAANAALDRGFGLVRPVATAADLIEAPAGMVAVDVVAEAQLALAGLKLGAMLDLLAAAGRPVKVLPKARDLDEEAFDVLG